MKMVLPFNLLPSSKDKDLLSIVPRTFPDVGSDFSSSGEQDEYGEDSMSGKNFGEGGSGGVGSGGSDTEPKAETEPDVGPTKGLRVASAADGGLGENIDYGGGPAAPRKAKLRSVPRIGASPSASPETVEVATVRRRCSGSFCSPPWATL
jgi:hypothetical protein